MTMDSAQLRQLIAAALEDIGLHSEAAVELLMLTAAVETNLGVFLRQVGGGPALGIFQMEPATHEDVWRNWLAYRTELGALIRALAASSARNGNPVAEELEWNLKYAAAMARVHYRRAPAPLPGAGDAQGLARYWKRWWNTAQGAGSVETALEKYRSLC